MISMQLAYSTIIHMKPHLIWDRNEVGTGQATVITVQTEVILICSL